MRQLRTAAAVGAVVLAVIAGMAVVGHPSGASDAPATVHLVARQTQQVEIPGPHGLLGGRFIGSDDLLRNGTRVGRGGRDCVAVAVAADEGSGRFQCTFTLALNDGMITAQALPRLSETGFDAFPAVVTGGTGRYLGASGRAVVTPLDATHIDLAIRLS